MRRLRGIEDVLGDAKRIALEYYQLTGKPLGITGELAEFEASRILRLKLCNARTCGYDATRRRNGKIELLQIKGRKKSRAKPYRGRVPSIDLEKPFDHVLLVIFDEHFAVYEIWEAPRAAVARRLNAPGSKARTERGSMDLSQFKSIAKCAWSANGAR